VAFPLVMAFGGLRVSDVVGLELADRMEGVYQPDFYDAYLDERLSRARQRAVRAPRVAPKTHRIESNRCVRPLRVSAAPPRSMHSEVV
jgi:hypothetical protein